MKDFWQLTVWGKAHELVLAVYRNTTNFPAEERYGLTSQLRRCAASVPANIAEGCGRDSDGDFARFLQIAMGSAMELDYHLLLARDLGYLAPKVYESLHERVLEVRRMLSSLLRKVHADRV